MLSGLWQRQHSVEHKVDLAMNISGRQWKAGGARTAQVGNMVPSKAGHGKEEILPFMPAKSCLVTGRGSWLASPAAISSEQRLPDPATHWASPVADSQLVLTSELSRSWDEAAPALHRDEMPPSSWSHRCQGLQVSQSLCVQIAWRIFTGTLARLQSWLQCWDLAGG